MRVVGGRGRSHAILSRLSCAGSWLPPATGSGSGRGEPQRLGRCVHSPRRRSRRGSRLAPAATDMEFSPTPSSDLSSLPPPSEDSTPLGPNHHNIAAALRTDGSPSNPAYSLLAKVYAQVARFGGIVTKGAAPEHTAKPDVDLDPDTRCRNCGKPGHLHRECTEPSLVEFAGGSRRFTGKTGAGRNHRRHGGRGARPAPPRRR